MAIFMVIAACYGVIQLAAVGSLTRSVRVGLLLTAVAVGIYGAGLVAVLLEIGYTRGVAEISGDDLSQVVRTASYTVDPFLEEVVKVLPLALVAAWHQRVRRQWGLTDYLLLGGATGAGFGLGEELLRHIHLASKARADDGGWSIPRGFTESHIPGPFEILFSWLPEPVSFRGILSLTAGAGISHLAWSALAGLGVGLIMRAPARWKPLGIVPLFYVWADHAVHNYEVHGSSEMGVVGALSVVINPLHGGLSAYVLLAVAAAGVMDLRVLRGKAGQLDLLTAPERMGRPSLQALGAYARVRPPWTPLVAWRFVLLRRSLLFASAQGPTRTEPLRQAVVEARDRIDASSTADAWQPVSLARLRLDRTRYRTVVIWLVLLAPAVGYFVLGGFPQTAGLQRLLTGRVMFVVSMLVMLACMGWLAWQAFQAVRALPAARQFGELTARIEFRLMIAGGAMVLGLLSAVRWLGGADAGSPAVSNLHMLEALGNALFYTAILLPILALFMFPPSSLALAGGGTMLVMNPALSTWLVRSAIMGILGNVLMQASGGGGGPGGSGSGSGGSGFDLTKPLATKEETVQGIRQLEAGMKRSLPGPALDATRHMLTDLQSRALQENVRRVITISIQAVREGRASTAAITAAMANPRFRFLSQVPSARAALIEALESIGMRLPPGW